MNHLSRELTVVLPVYNHWDLSLRCLNSLFDHSTALHDVFVIDNASRDQTPQNLSEFKQKFEAQGVPFTISTLEKNVGFGRACNIGVRHFLKQKNPYVAILSNDVWLMPSWDKPLIEVLKKNKLDCIGPHFDENPFEDALIYLSQDFVKKYSTKLRQHFVPMIPLFTRNAVERLRDECAGAHGGIYDERYYLTYEDTDLVHRMKNLSMRYAQTGASFVWHKSMGTRAHEPSGYEQESLKLFIEKWGFDPRPQPFWIRWRNKYWKYLSQQRKF